MATREDCIRALKEAAARLGESPTKPQYEQLDLTPAASTILRHCESWNAAKAAAGLETNPSRGSRVEQKPDDVTLPDGIEWESLSQDQRWHYRHREKNNNRTLERRQKLRQWLLDVKAQSSGCVQCGESEPVCLDFHHREPESKRMDVNKMVVHGYAKDALRDEIESCDLLCANCHWREHHDTPSSIHYFETIEYENDSTELQTLLTDPDGTPLEQFEKADRVRGWTYAYKRSQGCQRCGESDPVCLQFHHGDEKTMGVGKMISCSYPVGDVLAETEACTVLCANCHRREHHPASGTESG